MSLSTIFRFPPTGRSPLAGLPLLTSGSSFPQPGDRLRADRDSLVTPILACVALTVIGVAQLLLPGSPPPQSPDGLAPRRARPITAPALAEYSAILATPLFGPDRRPAESGTAPGSGSETLEGYAALGAVTGHAAASAVVSMPGGKVETLRGGDTINGWRLVGVSRTRLTFARQGERHDLVIGAREEQPAVTSTPPATTPTADQ